LSEVSALLTLLEEYFRTEAAKCLEENVRLRVIGRHDRVPPSLADAIKAAERLTSNCRGLQLRIAVDYSSRDAILRAACWMLSSVEVSQREFAKRLGEVTHATGPALDVDLLIRTGGDRRLSDFMLWECAYGRRRGLPGARTPLRLTPRSCRELEPARLSPSSLAAFNATAPSRTHA
jgi:undecaprenyl diphosphate synthase